jgi:hypothetical protein
MEVYMGRDKINLSYRLGFNIARGIHFYLSRRPAWLYRFAERNNIGERWMKVCKICAAMLFIFFVTDIHRYGAWYNGGTTYIKPWWQLACVLLWVPMGLVMIKCFFTYLERFNTVLIFIPLLTSMFFIMFFAGASIVYMVEDGFCILHGYVFLPDRIFNEIMELSWITGIMMGLAGFIGVIKDNGFRLTL